MFLEKRLCLLIELIVHGRKTLLTFPLCFLSRAMPKEMHVDDIDTKLGTLQDEIMSWQVQNPTVTIWLQKFTG